MPANTDTWKEYFTELGCIACGRKDVPHASCGLCATCLDVIKRQMEPGTPMEAN